MHSTTQGGAAVIWNNLPQRPINVFVKKFTQRSNAHVKAGGEHSGYSQ